MSSQRATFLTPSEYLEIERRAERKSEYYQGQMFAMACASRRHALVVTNIVIGLGNYLKSKPCELYSADMRLRVGSSGLYTYPDVVVVRGQPQFADDQRDTLLNPVLVIEVLSDSTADYDRGGKFELYRSLPSLVEYLTIAQDRPHLEQFNRQNSQWQLTEYNDLSQTIQLTSVGAALPLADIYAKVDFDR